MNTPTPEMTQTYHDTIAAVAHELWDKGGRQPDLDLHYWLEAERQVLARQKPGPVAATTPTTKTPPSVASRESQPVRTAAAQSKQSQRADVSRHSSQRRAPVL